MTYIALIESFQNGEVVASYRRSNLPYEKLVDLVLRYVATEDGLHHVGQIIKLREGVYYQGIPVWDIVYKIRKSKDALNESH